MAITYADVLYNIQNAYVAALASDNTYGTPAKIEYIQELSFEFESDNDDLMSAGLNIELLSVITKASGSIMEAALNWPAHAVITGDSASESGTTPNRVNTLDYKAGEDLDYFGLIFEATAKDGANAFFGFPKMKLDTITGHTYQQNQFRIGEAAWTAIAPSDSVKKILRVKRYETAATIPSTAGNFDTYFTGMFS